MEMPRSEQLSNNLDRLLKNRKRVRMPFFLSDFPAFFIFLLVSYCGIFFVTYCIFSSSSNSSSTSFIICRFWYQRFIGICNLLAFISFWIQCEGLIGSKGIKPIHQQLMEIDKLHKNGKLSVSKYEYHPTIFWLSSHDKFLHFVCFLGVLCSLLIIIPFYISTTPFFIICAICYGSIKTMGAEFMQLQWDSMLIEVNVICLWFELDSFLSFRSGTDIWISDTYSSRIAMIMTYWLHYRLMISAGFVKLSSGCPKWRDGTAMKYHFWTQPIPSPTSIIAWKYGLANKLSTYGSIISEIIFPFLIFFIPSPICRIIVFINTVGLMFLIFITGNFGFFNILTATLAITCIDDELWPNFMNPIHSYFGLISNDIIFRYNIIEVITTVLSFLWFILILIVSIRSLWHVSYRKLPISGSLRLFILKISMWSIVNSYGLFARMTTFRHELIFEGTTDPNFDINHENDDDFEWKTYSFKYKPGDINKRPPFCFFHLPRLDWRLWFLPLRKYNKLNDLWLLKFIKKLIKNEKGCKVIKLLKNNPFKYQEGIPIKAIRILQYEYRFINDEFDDEFGAKALGLNGNDLKWENGNWWIRRYLKCKYIPIITKEDVFNNDELKQFKLIQRITNIIKKKKKENENENDGNHGNKYQRLEDIKDVKEDNDEKNENEDKNTNKIKKNVNNKQQMESLLNSTITENQHVT